jgi:hypothetical protein
VQERPRAMGALAGSAERRPRRSLKPPAPRTLGGRPAAAPSAPGDPLLAALGRLCLHPHFAAALVLLTAVLCAPALFTGYQIDDYFQEALLRGEDPLERSLSPVHELFTFSDGDPATNLQFQNLGALPWWTDPEMKTRLWRPVSSITRVLDHAIAPESAGFAHAQSIGWMLLLALAVLALMRRIHGPTRLAALAALIYAIDSNHGMPVAWLANRNALITGLLGVLALIAHDRWRRDGWRPGRILAPIALMLALLAGEAGIATTAYLFSYALFLDRGPGGRVEPLRTRLLRLTPYAAVVVGWRLVYSALGYGTAHSGVYLDPLREPMAFLAAAPLRIPAMLGDQFLGFPSPVMLLFDGPLAIALAAGSTLALSLTAAVVWPVLRGRPEAGFWTVGLLLSAVPIAATFPAPRLLTFVTLGAAALVAMLIEAVLMNEGSARLGGPWTRRLVWLLFLLHLPLAALALPAQTQSARFISDLVFEPCDAAVPDDPSIVDKRVLFLNSNDLGVGFLTLKRRIEGRPAPESARLLASAMYDLDVEGIDTRTLDIGIPAGMQSLQADSLLRSADEPLPVGAVVQLSGMRAEIMSWNDADLVDRVRFRFDRPLTDDSLVWVCTRGGVPEICAPPAPGEVLRLPRIGG